MFSSYSSWLFLEQLPARRVFSRRSVFEDNWSPIANVPLMFTFGKTGRRRRKEGIFHRAVTDWMDGNPGP